MLRALRRSEFLVSLARSVRVGLAEDCRKLLAARRRSRIVDSYLRSNLVRRLQLGAGTNRLEGWLNTDYRPAFPGCIFLDVRERFPFADRTFDYVFSEHLIEHLCHTDGAMMLYECHRVLKPGGTVRLATPNLQRLCQLLGPNVSARAQSLARHYTDKLLPGVSHDHAVFLINNEFRNWGHEFLYDRATLQVAMEEAGFVDIVERSICVSDDANLRNLESHGRILGLDAVTAYLTMALEGRRGA